MNIIKRRCGLVEMGSAHRGKKPHHGWRKKQNRTLTLLALTSCLLLFLTFNIAFAVTTHNPFNLVCHSGKSFNVANDWDRNLRIEVTSGTTLNGTNATLTTSFNYGQLTFYSRNTTSITLSCENNPEQLLLGIEGATSFSHDDNFVYYATLPTAKTIIISWSWGLESWVDKYTSLGIGLTGVGMIAFAPLYVAWGIRKEGFNLESFHRIMIAMLFLILGLGLLFVWLWK
jgi:hypothetical protein